MLFRLSVLVLAVVGCHSKNNTEKIDARFQDKTFYQILNTFDSYRRKYPGPISSSVEMNSSEKKTFHLVVGCMIHGDEIGCLPALNEVLRRIESHKLKIKGALTVFIGNREAALQGKRFNEYDLNRIFANSNSRSLENTRGKEIASLIDVADLYIDIHQTIEPTSQAFYTFAFDKKSYNWARVLESAEVVVTRASGTSFAAGLMTSGEYAIKSGKPAITIETSQKGFSEESYQRSLHVILKALQIISTEKNPKSETDIAKLAQKHKELRLYKRISNKTFAHTKMKLDAGWQNFNPVSKGQRLGVDQDGNPMLAEDDGLLLFPKYPKRNEDGVAESPLPSDIYLLLKKAELSEFLKTKN